ncbi:hypothetical protein HDU96_000356 [Phlyctochytrium bullatum]|nr:hypothetical protein HDU96_000356 [Phlyctochytrium bullatum]
MELVVQVEPAATISSSPLIQGDSKEDQRRESFAERRESVDDLVVKQKMFDFERL